MINHAHAPAVRRLARAAALSPLLLVPLAALPAAADVPETWADGESVSVLEMLLLLVGAPLLLFLGITLLVYLPSMARGERYQPGLAWRNENEWFGGPSGGVGALDRSEAGAVGSGQEEARTEEDSARGGARGRW